MGLNAFELGEEDVNVVVSINFRLQVRRGADRSEIYNLAFSSIAQWLACQVTRMFISSASMLIPYTLSLRRHAVLLNSVLVPHCPAHLSLSLKGCYPSILDQRGQLHNSVCREGFQYVVAFCHQKNTVVIRGMDER